jgi:hypothetical protein
VPVAEHSFRTRSIYCSSRYLNKARNLSACSGGGREKMFSTGDRLSKPPIA